MHRRVEGWTSPAFSTALIAATKRSDSPEDSTDGPRDAKDGHCEPDVRGVGELPDHGQRDRGVSGAEAGEDTDRDQHGEARRQPKQYRGDADAAHAAEQDGPPAYPVLCAR